MDEADYERLLAMFETMAASEKKRLETGKPLPGNEGKSDPVIALIGEFAREGKIRAVAEAFKEFKRLHNSNAHYVRQRVPGMIMEYWRRSSTVADHEKTQHLALWVARQPNWSAEITQALESPSRFEAMVEQMLLEQNGGGGPAAAVTGYTDVDRDAFAKLYTASGIEFSGAQEQPFETAFEAVEAAIAAQKGGQFHAVRVWIEDVGFIDFPQIEHFYNYWVSNHD